jgi:1,4-alpha-glucan branching enzyme
MYAHPGKKLLFMGGEFGQRREWAHEESLDWDLLQFPEHQGVQCWLKHLHILYRGEPALHELDCEPAGFEWVDCTDWEKSVISFLRKGKTSGDCILVVCNFTPVTRYNYRVGVPRGGYWKEMLNSDAGEYGGSGQGNLGGVEATTVPSHGRGSSLSLVIPPLGIVFFKNEGHHRVLREN